MSLTTKIISIAILFFPLSGHGGEYHKRIQPNYINIIKSLNSADRVDVNPSEFYEGLKQFHHRCSDLSHDYSIGCYPYVSYFWMITGLEPVNNNCIIDYNNLQKYEDIWYSWLLVSYARNNEAKSYYWKYNSNSYRKIINFIREYERLDSQFFLQYINNRPARIRPERLKVYNGYDK